MYFYCECWGKDEQFRTIGDVENQLKECLNHDILNNVCLSLDEDDEYTYLENTFFKLYVYNEYITDVFNRSKYYHFENILQSEGFKLVSLYEPKQLDKDTRCELTELIQDITNEQFEEYLNDEYKCDDKFDHINRRVSLLSLSPTNIDLLRKYKDIIMNKYMLEDHFRITNLLKSDEYLHDKFKVLKEGSLKTNLLRYDAYKMILLREFEKYYNIQPLDVGAFSKMENFQILDNKLFLNIKKAFDSQKQEPKTIHDTEQLYIAMIKHLTNKDFITTQRIWSGKDRGGRTYKVNEESITHHIELHKISNKENQNYHDVMRKKYNLEKPEKLNNEPSIDDPFIDD